MRIKGDWKKIKPLSIQQQQAIGRQRRNSNSNSIYGAFGNNYVQIYDITTAKKITGDNKTDLSKRYRNIHFAKTYDLFGKNDLIIGILESKILENIDDAILQNFITNGY